MSHPATPRTEAEEAFHRLSFADDPRNDAHLRARLRAAALEALGDGWAIISPPSSDEPVLDYRGPRHSGVRLIFEAEDALVRVINRLGFESFDVAFSGHYRHDYAEQALIFARTQAAAL